MDYQSLNPLELMVAKIHHSWNKMDITRGVANLRKIATAKKSPRAYSVLQNTHHHVSRVSGKKCGLSITKPSGAHGNKMDITRGFATRDIHLVHLWCILQSLAPSGRVIAIIPNMALNRNVIGRSLW